MPDANESKWAVFAQELRLASLGFGSPQTLLVSPFDFCSLIMLSDRFKIPDFVVLYKGASERAAACVRSEEGPQQRALAFPSTKEANRTAEKVAPAATSVSKKRPANESLSRNLIKQKEKHK
jgi:hypothetical protein